MNCKNPLCKGEKKDYLAHKRAGEEACAASKSAWRTYYAKRRK